MKSSGTLHAASQQGREALEALLTEAGAGRRALKRAAAALDAMEPGAKGALVALARERGVELPDEAAGWPGKRLLRRALAREEAARERSNPIRRDGAFTCGGCDAAVAPGGGRVRDHCPRCLRSLHVDVVPGDRAAGCGGLMDPTGLELRGGEAVIHYRCRRCGAAGRCRAHPDDDAVALAELSGRGA